MKVWQLSAVVGDSDLLQRIAFRNADWHKYGQWYRDLSRIVNTQDRAKVDDRLPDNYVIEVLSKVDRKYFKGSDGWLRIRRFSSDDEVVSAVEAFKRYGGTKLADAPGRNSYGTTHTAGLGGAWAKGNGEPNVETGRSASKLHGFPSAGGCNRAGAEYSSSKVDVIGCLRSLWVQVVSPD